jgi:hypothetical protein
MPPTYLKIIPDSYPAIHNLGLLYTRFNMQRPTQRGRLRKYATAKDKAAADYKRQRNKRQKAAAGDRGLPYSNFHNLHYPV